MDWGILSDAIGPRARQIQNLLYGRSITVSEPFQLPTGSLTIMALIEANANSSQAALARRAGITGSSLVGIIDELERRGLVSRIRSKEDRRRNALVLTAEGAMVLSELFGEVTKIEAPIRDEFSAEELAQFTNFLDRALSALGEQKKA